MTEEEQQLETFLLALFNRADGDCEYQVSMYDLGFEMGLDRAESSALAEELMVEEMIELRSLAGGVSLTVKGVDWLQQRGVVQCSTKAGLRLSGESVLTDGDRVAVSKMIDQVKQELSLQPHSYEQMEEVVFELKTLEIQLLSGRPKFLIVKAVLTEIGNALPALQCVDSARLVADLLR